jgi:hypothetical protein
LGEEVVVLGRIVGEMVEFFEIPDAVESGRLRSAHRIG